MTSESMRSLKVAGLFAGIGGLELGLDRAGHSTELLCEVDPVAAAVLSKRFPGVPIAPDVRQVKRLPDVDLVAAGFPCQDLSLAGTQAGLRGARSGLVDEVFRLVRQRQPEFILLENVLYLVKRQRGALLRYITTRLEELGYRWAYRVVDSRGFGLPQRRQRVIILASCGSVDPSSILFSKAVEADIDDRIADIEESRTYGFYWTEGKRAVGWAVDAVPTIKGGSGLGIPSPPAIFDPLTGLTGTPTIRDGERLQGFASGWTDIILDGERLRPGRRWTMVGNAVSVPLSKWLGKELAKPRHRAPEHPTALHVNGRPMPMAASSANGDVLSHEISMHVEVARHPALRDFLKDPVKPLSSRAINGFLSRVDQGVMTLPHALLDSLRSQAEE